MRLSLASAIALTLTLSGCATVFTNNANDPTPYDQQVVPVVTEPAGAKCEADGQSITTPGMLKLSRQDGHNVSCYLDGFDVTTAFIGSRTNSLIWLNLLFPPGFIVDLVDRQAFTLTPETIRVALHKK